MIVSLRTLATGIVVAMGIPLSVRSSERAPASLEAVVADDGEATIALLRAHADHAFFNEPRNAVQILGCRGILVAHIPLASGQLEALRQAIE